MNKGLIRFIKRKFSYDKESSFNKRLMKHLKRGEMLFAAHYDFHSYTPYMIIEQDIDSYESEKILLDSLRETISLFQNSYLRNSLFNQRPQVHLVLTGGSIKHKVHKQVL